ncbi:MAG: hypothetical protein FD122_1931 [Stygiobacter sp.]|nr:MAG: hypothetical protein FD122_1931 [Stygiobacter sp.]KAF0211639.1 MAG: hypothetical protein FD178_3373 [Ignavibacteria bacterium]
MRRRDFLKSGLLAGASVTLPGVYGNIFARTSSTTPPAFDLVAIKGGEPDAMFDEAIKQLGGIKNFVKKNQKVLVKPNIGWDAVPERGANTHPKLVSRVIKHCFDAGAKEVYVFDHTCDDWKRSYANSGIEKAVKDAGGTIVTGGSESMYQEVSINAGKSLTKAKVHELVLDSDVFINMPILKSHSSTKLSLCMKNMMGVVWDRGYWHRNDLHQCIADYATYNKKPTLNIIDAYYMMKQNGPRGVSTADVAVMKSQILCTDMVVADAAAAKMFGIEPSDVSYIKIADSMGTGKMDLSKLNIKRIIL